MSRQDSGYVQLREAIKQKDKQTAINLISQNVNVNNSKIKSHTPLHWAIIQFNDLDIVTMLLERGANIHVKNHVGHKPLDVAIMHKRTPAAFLLIQKGGLIGEDLNALLIKAIERNSNEIVKMLLDHGLQYNPSINLKHPLKVAVSKGHTKIIEHIIPHCPYLKPSEKYIPNEFVTGYNLGANKNCVELLLNWNFTMDPNSCPDRKYVCAAVKKGFLPIVLQLLEYGIDVNTTDPETGLYLLQIACLNKHHEIVENLLKHNAFVNVTTPRKHISSGLRYFYRNSSLRHVSNNICGITCLDMAVHNNDPLTTKHLLRYGIKIINDPTFFNITGIAIQKNHEEIVRIFLDYGVDVCDIDSEGKTLLHYCVSSPSEKSRYEIAELLFERGADVHVQIPGSSLLFEAIENRHHDIANLFLAHHGDVQYISPDGNTPLHKAIEKNFDIEFITTLLQKGANPNDLNNNGQTSLHIACERKCNYYRTTLLKNTTEKIQLLLQNNANIEAVDAKGETPFFSACCTANLEAVKCLLNNGANVHHTNSENLTTLFIAAKSYRNSNSEIIEILLKHKVNIHCMDEFGKSLIHIAVENRNLKLIKLLAHTQINFNSVNKEGNTPLHIAIHRYRSSLDLIECLIKYGANLNILDKKKETPLQSAIKTKTFMQRKLTKHHNYFYEGGTYSGDTNGSEYNSDDDMSDINQSAKMIKILKKHIIKLKAAGLKVNQQNFNIVYKRRNNRTSDDEFSDSDHYCYVDCRVNKPRLELKCVYEIEKMRMEHTGVNNITFYDFLKKNIHFLSRFVRNRQIRKTLESPIYDEKFPLYIDIVRSRFRDAKFRYRLMDSAKKYFNINICQQLTDNCMDKIFSYLSIKEIKMFIRATKPLNG